MALGQVFLRVLRFTPVTIIPPVLRTHLHVHVAFTGRIKRRSLGIFQKAVFSRKSWSVGKESTSIFIACNLSNFRPKCDPPNIIKLLHKAARTYATVRIQPYWSILFSAAFSEEPMSITAPLNFPTLYFASNLRFLGRRTSTDWELQSREILCLLACS